MSLSGSCVIKCLDASAGAKQTASGQFFLKASPITKVKTFQACLLPAAGDHVKAQARRVPKSL
jgi:hypothetical protein